MVGLELICLALNVYFEARDQPYIGQLAVAQVTLQRVEDKSGEFPNTICEVVYQGGEALNQCHFSWYCNLLSDIPTDNKAWEVALSMAEIASAGARIMDLEGVLHYHSTEISDVWWTENMEPWMILGDHIFWKIA